MPPLFSRDSIATLVVLGVLQVQGKEKKTDSWQSTCLRPTSSPNTAYTARYMHRGSCSEVAGKKYTSFHLSSQPNRPHPVLVTMFFGEPWLKTSTQSPICPFSPVRSLVDFCGRGPAIFNRNTWDRRVKSLDFWREGTGREEIQDLNSQKWSFPKTISLNLLKRAIGKHFYRFGRHAFSKGFHRTMKTAESSNHKDPVHHPVHHRRSFWCWTSERQAWENCSTTCLFMNLKADCKPLDLFSLRNQLSTLLDLVFSVFP